MGAVEKGHGLKLISWILAYAVWTFIFLIPVIGIVLVVMFLLKNRSTTARSNNTNLRLHQG